MNKEIDLIPIQKLKDLMFVRIQNELNLNQSKLLAYVILNAKPDGKTKFYREDFTNTDYKYKNLVDDIKELAKIIMEYPYSEELRFSTLFECIDYDSKTDSFIFKWNDYVLPYILK